MELNEMRLYKEQAFEGLTAFFYRLQLFIDRLYFIICWVSPNQIPAIIIKGILPDKLVLETKALT